jgi:hypothetical protein
LFSNANAVFLCSHLKDHHGNIKKLEGIKEENLSLTTCSTPSSTSSTPLNKLLMINICKSNNKEIDGLDDVPWSTVELENLDLMNHIHDWNFPIFTFFERSNNYVLSKVRVKTSMDVVFNISN